MKKLTKNQILKLHTELIKATGGTDGLRDEALLDSALNAPFQGFGETDVYPSIQQKAARLGFGLIKNHAFKQTHRFSCDVGIFDGQRNRIKLCPGRTFRHGSQGYVRRIFV